jgi:AcrR family transcriptional regulator
MTGKTPKEVLLRQVVDYFVADGLGDLSLRQIAAAIGTSHRMLLYHFGSKSGLLVEVVRAVEARTRAQLNEMGAGANGATGDVIRHMWRYVADPAQGDFERLFFALYGRALQGDEQVRPLLGESIESWLEANEALAAAQGIPPERARTHARLGLAVVRGLLLDLLATGDRRAVGGALEAFAAGYDGSWWEAAATTVPSTTVPSTTVPSTTASTASAPAS